MYEVTCFNCGNIAHITPDADHCIICKSDLKHLITPEYASKYFYQRAAQLADAGEVTLAVLEVDRGLSYRSSSELHLLAAILSQRMSNFDQMRQHVAAIPVDDALRGEAEWLLRANQAQRAGVRLQDRAALPGPTMPVASRPPRRDSRNSASAAQRASLTKLIVRGVVSTFILLLAVIAAWVGLGPGAQLINIWWQPAQTVQVDQPASAAQTQGVGAPVQNNPTGLAGSETATLTVTLPTPTTPLLPTPTVEPVVASTPQVALQAAGGTPYDLKGVLQQNNQPALADLPVAATLQGVTLTLQGIVPMFIQRQTLVELAQKAPDVGAVNAVDLLVRVPVSYTVQAGDTLWSISASFYGENYVAEIIAANRETLPDPSALRLGQVLQLPPLN